MQEKDAALGQNPQINLSRSTTGRMWLVSACAALVVFQSALTDSFASLGIALAAVFAGVLAEVLVCYQAGRPPSLKDGSAVASALILTILLPHHTHPAYAAAGAVFAMAVVKHSFGGLGANWLNPAAGGWLFVRFSWPHAFRQVPEGGLLSAAPALGGSPADTAVRAFLNDTIFSAAGAELPGGYIDLFISSAGGIIADRGVAALLLGTIIITASQANRSWVPALYLGIYGILIRVLGELPFGGGWNRGDVFFGFLSGGTLAAAFLLAGDPATGPKSAAGMLGVTVGAALFSFLFRYAGAEFYGAFLAVLFFNTLVPLVRELESRRFYERRRPL